MKRLLLLASVGVLVAPAIAQGATLRGVVIAKDARRHTVVIASKNGTVSTLRTGTPAGKARLGRLLAARVAKLPDGTYSAGALRPLGKTTRARFGAVVVRRQGIRLVVSAGHSVFVVRLRAAARASASDGTLSPGDEVDVDADIRGGGLSADRQNGVTESGHTDQLELEGIYLSTKDNVLDVAVVHRGLVHVAIPDGLTLPALSAGDQVALVVSLGPDTAFTLVSIDNEDSADSSDDGGDGVDIDKEHSEFSVVGILVALSDRSASVKVEGRDEPVTCAIKQDAERSGDSIKHDQPAPPQVGDLVEMRCKYADGRFVLTGLRKKSPPSGEDTGKLEVSGSIAALDSTNVSVAVEGRSDPVTCLLPDGADMLGFAVGDAVQMYCKYDGAHWLLKGLRSDHAGLAVDENKAWFGFSGMIVGLSSEQVSVQVEGRPDPVTCAVPAGMNLEGFAVGDAVRFSCINLGEGFKVKELVSDRAAVLEDGAAWFDLRGTISSLSSSEVALTVEHHDAPVTCAVPEGTDLSAFAVGEPAELKCRFVGGQFVLASLQTEHASIVLEP